MEYDMQHRQHIYRFKEAFYLLFVAHLPLFPPIRCKLFAISIPGTEPRGFDLKHKISDSFHILVKDQVVLESL